jgi:hypothetical protein
MTDITMTPPVAAGQVWRSRVGGTTIEVEAERPDGRFAVAYPLTRATAILSGATIVGLYEVV